MRSLPIVALAISMLAPTTLALASQTGNDDIERAGPFGRCLIEENEPDCGLPVDTVNGGCFSDPPVFTEIAVGDTFCGTVGANGEARDSDWYRFTVDRQGAVLFTVRAEFPALIGIVRRLCDAPTFEAFAYNDSGPGDLDVLGFVSPGEYACYVTTAHFSGVACGAGYEATLEYVNGGCGNCFDFECRADGVIEIEGDCGLPADTVNGGCDTIPHVFNDIECGDSICGTLAFDGVERDSDWYRFVVETDQAVTVKIQTEVGLRIGVVEGLCDDPTYVFSLEPGDDFVEYSVSGDVSPGVYALVVTTLGSHICGARYKATLECEPECRADFDANGAVNAADVGAFISQYFVDLADGTLITDFDNNGIVNAADIGAFLSQYYNELENPDCAP